MGGLSSVEVAGASSFGRKPGSCFCASPRESGVYSIQSSLGSSPVQNICCNWIKWMINSAVFIIHLEMRWIESLTRDTQILDLNTDSILHKNITALLKVIDSRRPAKDSNVLF